MNPPRPPALRLVRRASVSRWPAPPMGLAAWDAGAQAVAILLDATSIDVDDPAQVAGQIPGAAELPPATPVFVLGVASGRRIVLRWLERRVPVTRAARCTALLARGYVDIGAGVDSQMDLAWGFSSPC